MKKEVITSESLLSLFFFFLVDFNSPQVTWDDKI